MSVRESIAQILLLGGCGLAVAAQPAAADSLLQPGTLVISSSTYDPTVGAVASLQVGTTLAGTATATSTAIADDNYVNVWNNTAPDPAFGVTAPILLTDVDVHSDRVLGTLSVPTDQVVTSFSSKSELSLHFERDRHGSHLLFAAYAGAGTGALDVSNSDAVVGQDPTNPVSVAFGSAYAFHRTIVSLDDGNRFSYTPTIAYGGDNGRSALQGSNGLYYMVGDANNGDAAAFGSATNGTDPDVTVTTGLEVVDPINGRSVNVDVPAAGSAEVDPYVQYPFGKKGALDKPGKDDNFRGLTEFNGALYLTKGSGSNGINTVYTVINTAPVAQGTAAAVPVTGSLPAAGNVLPTPATAGQVSISVLNGFPTDSARATGGDYAPFALFFANDHTLYVTDEGTGGSADLYDTTAGTPHAGLQKWSLVNGTWQLDYTLTAGAIGQVDTGLTGDAGQYPDVTTIGLRNLAGRVNRNGTVTLWAVTSTSSTAGDTGADPNRVVEITDELAATALTGKVADEAFRTVAGPTYGTVYRGVAYVDDDRHDQGRLGGNRGGQDRQGQGQDRDRD